MALALGTWRRIAGFAVAMGPLVGGAVVEGISWQWVFWLNVPVGLILLPLATQLRESYGADKHLDIPGVVLGGLGLLGLVWGLVNGNSDGWTSPQIVGSLVVGAVILAAFVVLGATDERARCCRCASSATARSRQPTVHRSSCTSGCSGRSSC